MINEHRGEINVDSLNVLQGRSSTLLQSQVKFAAESVSCSYVDILSTLPYVLSLKSCINHIIISNTLVVVCLPRSMEGMG